MPALESPNSARRRLAQVAPSPPTSLAADAADTDDSDPGSADDDDGAEEPAGSEEGDTAAEGDGGGGELRTAVGNIRIHSYTRGPSNRGVAKECTLYSRLQL